MAKQRKKNFKILTVYDSVIESGLGLQLGKLLIAYQYLEGSIGHMIRAILGECDPLGLIDDHELTYARKLEQIDKALGSAVKKAGELPEEVNNALRICEGLEQTRRLTKEAKELLDERNTIVHGILETCEDGALQFKGKKRSVVFNEGTLADKEQKALYTAALVGQATVVVRNCLRTIKLCQG